MVEHQKKKAKVLDGGPNIDTYMSSVGASGRSAIMNQGSITLMLKPFGQRGTVDEVMTELRKKTSKIPGIRLFLQGQPAIRIGGMSSKAQYQVSVSSADLPTLYKT